MKMALAFSGGKDSLACFYLKRAELDCAIYVDTGYAYPETKRMVELVSNLIPMHIVKSDRKGQHAREGWPADVVPINWTKLGHMVTGPKPVMLQSYLGCCWENISLPLFQAAHQLGITHLVTGQRNEEAVKASARHNETVAGLVRLHPIEYWTTQQVFDYLATKMTIPEHFYIKHSSLDCYDCTGYEHDSRDRVQWTAQKYPEFYGAYAERKAAINEALKESLCPAT